MDLPSLPPNPALWTHVLENPVPLAIFLLLFASALGYCGVRTAQKLCVRAGLLALAAAVGVLVIARVIQTPAELLVERTHDLVEAAVVGDTISLADLLANDVQVLVADQPVRFDREALIAAAALLPRYVQSNAVRETAASVPSWGASTATTSFAQTTTISNQPTPNAWIVEWRRDADGDWRAVRLNWVRINITATPTADLLRPF